MLKRGITLAVAFAATALAGGSMLSDDSSAVAWLVAIVLGTIMAFGLARLLTALADREVLAMVAGRDIRIAAMCVGWSAFPRGMRALDRAGV